VQEDFALNRFCFRSLGFKNKEIKSYLKSLSKVAVKSSFVIWLSRDSNVWDKDFVESLHQHSTTGDKEGFSCNFLKFHSFG